MNSRNTNDSTRMDFPEKGRWEVQRNSSNGMLYLELFELLFKRSQDNGRGHKSDSSVCLPSSPQTVSLLVVSARQEDLRC